MSNEMKFEILSAVLPWIAMALGVVAAMILIEVIVWLFDKIFGNDGYIV